MADNFLHDVKVYRNIPAYTQIMSASPLLDVRLYNLAVELAVLYRAKVGVKTGKLRASAEANIRQGGHNMDRTIGVVTIANSGVVAEQPWRGKPFYYGVYHEEGTDGGASGKGSKRAKRRKADGPRGPVAGYHELRQAAHEWRGSL